MDVVQVKKIARVLMPGLNRQVALFMLYSLILHIGMFGILDVVLNFYFVSLGYKSDTIGVLQSLPRIGGLLTGLPVGLVANRIGTRRIILFSTALMAGSVVGLVIAPSLLWLGVSRFMIGFFYGAQQIANNPFMGRIVEKQHQTHLFAYHNVISMAGTAVGSLIGGVLPSIIVAVLAYVPPTSDLPAAQTPFAYGTSIIIASILVFLSVVPLFWVHEPHGKPLNDNGAKWLQLDVPWGLLLKYVVPMLFFGFTGGLTFPFYNLFFRTTFNIPDATVGTVLSMGWIGMGLIPLVNPPLNVRFGGARAIGITMSVAAVAFFALSIAPVLTLATAAFVVAVSSRNTMQPLFQPLVMSHLPPELHNIASSIGMVVWNGGWFCATAVSGYWQQTYGFDFIMQVVAVGVMITGASVLLIFSQRAISG
jgi:MFS family permease